MNSAYGRSSLWQLVVLWALLMAVSLLTRTFVPIDETRYVTVAWEMWLRGDFLVPHLNGATYAHKPPLLFWLYDLGWWLFGVNDWWPRLVAPLFGLGSLALTFLLARRLWPERPRVAMLASWLLFGSVFWTGYTTAAMFDMLVTFFTLLGLYGVWQAGKGQRIGWLWLGIAIGLGILAKGPVILLHTLPAALLAPWWSSEASNLKARWYLHLLGAFVLGAVIALAWAIPAALRGGEAYANAIFWGQTANRVVDSFAHKRAFWWYLPLLPLIFYPWAWWPPVWRGLASLTGEKGVAALRFCLAWLIPGFLFLMLISGKQVHYLLPLFPAVALLGARGIEHISRREFTFRLPGTVLVLLSLGVLSLIWWQDRPDWAEGIEPAWGALPLLAGMALLVIRTERLFHAVRILTLVSVLVVIALHLVLKGPLNHSYDLTPVAEALKELQTQGAPIVHESKYAGEYHFLARLKQPLKVLRRKNLETWARQHPDGYILYYFSSRQKERIPAASLLVHRYRGDYVAIIPSEVYLQNLDRL